MAIMARRAATVTPISSSLFPEDSDGSSAVVERRKTRAHNWEVSGSINSASVVYS